MAKVSIIILTYNSEKYIERLIKSIHQYNTNEDFETIIVDNNSADNTIDVISKIQDPKSKIQLIKNKENVGFAKGINIGARVASGEYLLFINPDTEFNHGDTREMLQIFSENRSVGIVGGKLIDREGKDEKSAGRFFGVYEVFLIALGLDETFNVRFAPNIVQKVDFVSGGFMMVRLDIFEELGGFDENLFMYIEDIELCYRAKMKGYFTYFTPNVILVHEAHGSSNRGFAVKNIYRGILYFHKKHGTQFSYSVVKTALFIKAALLVILGKIINNKYLISTYSEALKI